jgi:NAD(P)H-quinone oxidoreductase subunit 5
MLAAFLAIAVALLAYAIAGADPLVLSYGAWFSSGEDGFAIELLVDGMSLAFATLATAIAGIVAAFSHRYLHRERGYNRYFVLFAVFVTGILLVALAGSIEILLAGWELLGLGSALLVGFFHERPAPSANALRVFVVYRIGDAGMLAAAVLLHHIAGSGSLALLFGTQAATPAILDATQATIIALLLLTAVAAKSALLPLSGWLPRAMEGPTPSSAVYYGALSIHAGCFLLLRAAPLFEHAPAARAAVAIVGLATAAYATLTTRVQSDIKSALAYASLTQVGIIVVEIALGLHTIAFVHIVGHALYRLLQFLSAPNLLHDLHELENATQGVRGKTGAHLQALVPRRLRAPLYLLALERGFLDPLVDRYVVGPFLRGAAALDRFDRRLCELASRRFDAPDDRHG